jgi:hypothetical protein
MKDSNEVEIQVGDLILYGYGFYQAPVVGRVVHLYKNSFKYEYTNAHWDNELIVSTSICKMPHFCKIVNKLYSNELIKLFNLHIIGIKPKEE